MASFTLAPDTPFDGLRLDFANLTIEGVTDRALVSIAVPLGGADAINSATQNGYGVATPTIGQYTTANTDNALILGMAIDQFFTLFDDPGGDPVIPVRQRLGQSAYLVDQSDSWAMLRISGDNCRPALERICPLDLDPAAFGPGQVTRTMMEHLAVIILCEATDRYLLLSPRSSAPSFLHAVEISARNVA